MSKMNSMYLLFVSVVFLYITIPSISVGVEIGSVTSYNVISYGATPDGVENSTEAFMDTWAAACAVNGSSVMVVPKGRYLLYPLSFDGRNCNCSDMSVRILGTLVAPTSYHILGEVNSWLLFYRVTNLSITAGVLDAQGSSLWARKAAYPTDSPLGATTLRLSSCSNVVVKGLVSLNSQLYHMVINNCDNIRVEAVRMLASAQSPNTDGIHVQTSNNVVIFNTNIQTGDDCVSIGPGTTNLWIQRVACGPGHGISIGSLGKEAEEEGVENVTVKYSVFTGSTNGLRIKSWARPSSGFVRGVLFDGVVMRNVQNPIIIDQNYCPHHLNCPTETSGIQISDVLYRNIAGSSATEVGITLNCSTKYPCTGIRLQNVNLTYQNQTAQSVCNHAIGQVLDSLYPHNCFYS